MVGQGAARLGKAGKETMTFKWKAGARIKISAQVAGERVTALREKLGRGVTAIDVLDDARHTGSPLHKVFEWNDYTAAERHRLEIAGHLLRCLVYVRVKIQHPKEDKPRIFTNVRAFYPVSENGASKAYAPTAKVLSSADMRAQLLEAALQDLNRIKAKYKQLTELTGVFAAVEEFKRSIRKVKARAARAKK